MCVCVCVSTRQSTSKDHLRPGLASSSPSQVFGIASTRFPASFKGFAEALRQEAVSRYRASAYLFGCRPWALVTGVTAPGRLLAGR